VQQSIKQNATRHAYQSQRQTLYARSDVSTRRYCRWSTGMWRRAFGSLPMFRAIALPSSSCSSNPRNVATRKDRDSYTGRTKQRHIQENLNLRYICPFPLAQQPKRAREASFFEVSRSHTTVGRPPLGKGSARRRDLYVTTLTTDRHPYPRRDSNPQSQEEIGRRPSPHATRPAWSANLRYVL
jgi:hypothetical protein